eukprot:6156028-Pleurochrysis_carterae.AAC.1
MHLQRKQGASEVAHSTDNFGTARVLWMRVLCYSADSWVLLENFGYASETPNTCIGTFGMIRECFR